MSRYACITHGRTGETPEEACSECRAAQLAAQAAAGKNNLQFFRNLDRAAAPTKANPWTKPLPSPEYVASLPPAAVEASGELAAVLGAEVGDVVQTSTGRVVVTGVEPDGAVLTQALAGPVPPAPATLADDPMRIAFCGPELTRLAGIDPGSHWIAIEVAVASGGLLHHVAATVIEIGRSVELKTPKIKKRKDGTTYTVTQRRVITDEDKHAALGAVVAFLELHNVEHAAVEDLTHLFGEAASPEAAAGRAVGLLRGCRIGGIIEGVLMAAHRYDDAGALVRSVPHVTSVSGPRWRAFARSYATPQTPWPLAVRVGFGGTLPEHPGEHVLDAAGVCAWLTRPPEPPKRPREPREPGTKRPKGERSSASRNGARAATSLTARATKLAARATAGCTCSPHGPPSRSCPAAAAHLAGLR